MEVSESDGATVAIVQNAHGTFYEIEGLVIEAKFFASASDSDVERAIGKLTKPLPSDSTYSASTVLMPDGRKVIGITESFGPGTREFTEAISERLPPERRIAGKLYYLDASTSVLLGESFLNSSGIAIGRMTTYERRDSVQPLPDSMFVYPDSTRVTTVRTTAEFKALLQKHRR
jgi:hypothetical protein